MRKYFEASKDNPSNHWRTFRVSAVTVFTALLAVACGVKGKPLPPLEPAAIGRGAPTYKRAAEQAKPIVVPGLPEPTASPSPRRGGK